MKNYIALFILFIVFGGMVLTSFTNPFYKNNIVAKIDRPNVMQAQDVVNPLTVVLTKKTPPVCQRMPAEVILAIDNSNSMSQGRLSQAKSAMISFLQILQGNQHSHVSLVEFNDDQKVDLGLEDVNTAGKQIVKAISNLSRPGAGHGGTCFECALDDPNNTNDILGVFQRERALDQANFDQHRKVVIVLTDGRFNRYFNSSGSIVGDVKDPLQLQITLQKTQAAVLKVSRAYNAEFWFVQYPHNGDSDPYRNQQYLKDLVTVTNQIANGEAQYYEAHDLQDKNAYEVIYNQIAYILRGGADINGFVFDDTNNDGLPEDNEPLLNGVKVNLKEVNTGNISSELTGPPDYQEGNYNFIRTCNADFDLSVVPPPGYTFSSTIGPYDGVPHRDVGLVQIRNKKAYEINTVMFGLKKSSSTVISKGSISGCVYNDSNQDKIKNDNEQTIGGITTIVTGGTTGTSVDGCFTFGGLDEGDYTVELKNIPSQYISDFPLLVNQTPTYQATVNMTLTCHISPDNGPQVCTNGNITHADFGLVDKSTLSLPWIRTYGLDARLDDGFINNVPTAACNGSYTAVSSISPTLPSVVTPGILITGTNSIIDFSPGSASQDPYNWKVKDSYDFPPGSQLNTSYERLSTTIKRGGITPINIIGTSGCPSSSFCQPQNLPSGVYEFDSDPFLRLTLNSWTVPQGRNYILLVHGDVKINGPISVKQANSSLTVVTSGNIIVDKTVGQPPACPSYNQPGGSSQIDGFYSTDACFIIESTDDPTTEKMLNMSGGVVTNARLDSGCFLNKRNLGDNNKQYPSFSIRARPDLILNTPEALKVQSLQYQELAP